MIDTETAGKAIFLVGDLYLFASAIVTYRRGYFATKRQVFSRIDSPREYWRRVQIMLTFAVGGLALWVYAVFLYAPK